MQLNIKLPPDIQHILNEQMATGYYLKPEDAIAEALRFYYQEQKQPKSYWSKINDEINIQDRELANGTVQFIDGETFMTEMRDKYT
jgi:hypothetical protein